mgnify:CR=1 FL=1
MSGMIYSNFYCAPNMRKEGITPIKFNFHEAKEWVDQDSVIESVKDILSHKFIDCRYRLMTSYLKQDGYQINHKKLYRIMKEAGLLKSEKRINRSGSGHKFVKFRKVKTTRPFLCLEMIKMVWIPKAGKMLIYYL